MSDWAPLADWVSDDEKENVLLHLDAAYREVLDEKWGRLGMWQYTMEYVQDTIAKALERHGFTTAPLYMMAFLERVAPPAPMVQVEHLRLIKSCMTDVTDTVQRHIRYRVANEGNVHFEFIGRTGSGKSSCALTVADWMSPIPTDQVGDHVNLEFAQVGQKLAKLKRGEALVQDELLALSGDGAKTTQMALENIMDTLRQSGVSLLTCSPETRDLRTMQAGFEAIAWNTADRRTLFLVHVDGLPVGVTAIPWARPEVWATYKGWKEANTERSRSGHFKDTTALAHAAMRIVGNEDYVEFICGLAGKPKKLQFRESIEFFMPEMATSQQADRIAGWLFMVSYNFEKMAPNLQKLFGVAPTKGLQRIANKCRRGAKA